MQLSSNLETSNSCCGFDCKTGSVCDFWSFCKIAPPRIAISKECSHQAPSFHMLGTCIFCILVIFENIVPRIAISTEQRFYFMWLIFAFFSKTAKKHLYLEPQSGPTKNSFFRWICAGRCMIWLSVEHIFYFLLLFFFLCFLGNVHINESRLQRGKKLSFFSDRN